MAYETLFEKPRTIIGTRRLLNGCSACGMGEDYDPFAAMARSAAEAAALEALAPDVDAASAQVNYQAGAGDPNSPAAVAAAAAARAAAEAAGGGGGGRGVGGLLVPLLLAAGAVLIFWGTANKKPR